MSELQKIAFLDRDGTLIWEPLDEQVDRLDKISLLPGVIPALLRIKAAGYQFVMITNQDGLGTDSFPEDAFRVCQDFVLELFASQGILFREVFVCPHFPADGCTCRKPLPGHIGDFMRQASVDRDASFVAGDRDTDLEFAAAIGLTGYRLANKDGKNGGLSWAEIAREICDQPRRATVTRKTKETDIRIDLDLDHEGPIEIKTGIGFFDHMLEQIAKHGGFSLALTCNGDLEVDEHHTVEDVALALGKAFSTALGDKRGIGRYGFTLPMDEAQAQVVLDLAGRAVFRFDGEFPRDSVGELPTEMVVHFFRSLSDSLGAALHISVDGENTHHMVEGCFKATGRAMRQAKTRVGTELPSTKGTL
ncbi:MAG: bifunctional histidinol-phosphatase/imidazoleglycerol-phosphate dehydratase HisB [Gammaproteobacteria bacterium]|nr:bifunctional histidinol-phosphatase/imidazoleglycerol-phosphate dehydratase [Chromatiales bacterium]MDP6675387.1 bifunctional histidinol-phosphatase/imidazoleglycerol-phosphate dehydratase HisB [Gammaproteobacteria bacterium]